MRGLSSALVAGVALTLFAGADAQNCDSECLGFDHCDDALASGIYGVVGMSCLHLEDWHCCDCSGCDCGDCSVCAGYIAEGLSCFDIYDTYGEDCHTCGCECAEPNEQSCEASWSAWGECGGGDCGGFGTRYRTWQVTQKGVASGTTEAGLSCCLEGGPDSCLDTQDSLPEICEMPACTTISPDITTGTTTLVDAIDVCTDFNGATVTASVTRSGAYVSGQSFVYSSINPLATCEDLITDFNDSDGNPIDAALVFQCGCACGGQCQYSNGAGTYFTADCFAAYECLEPCDYTATYYPDEQLFTNLGTEPVSCNGFQEAQIAEFVSVAFDQLTGQDAIDKEAQLLEEGAFGCEYQAASSNELLAQCQDPIRHIPGVFETDACSCQAYNTTTAAPLTTTTTTPEQCASTIEETNACFALMAEFPDLENQCFFFLKNYNSAGELDPLGGIDCRPCGCQQQCPEYTTPPDTTTSTSTTSTTSTTTTTTTTTGTTTTSTTGDFIRGCNEIIPGTTESCQSLVVYIPSCSTILDVFQVDCSCACTPDSTSTDLTTTEEADTTTTVVCEECLLGHTCDEIQALWRFSDNQDRYKCYELESAYGCDCSNCECTYDSTTTTTTAGTEGCVGTCVGGVSCDELGAYFFNELDTIYTCEMLEEEFSDTGCDCTGCECGITTPSIVDVPCDDNCQGFTCDDWDAFLGGGDFSCAIMEEEYGCDCTGCDCVGGHGECFAATFDGIDLCTIGSQSMTCDEWQSYEFGGESLTCQYLEFYFGCDCTNCQCAGEPNCVRRE